MKVYIPPKDSYLAPAGCFQAVCVEAKQYSKKVKRVVQQFIRLVFTLRTNGPKGTRYKVGKNYPVENLSELHQDLEQWLGERVLDTEFDLDSLQGEEATVHITHIHNEDFDQAYRAITQISPPEQPLEEAMEEAA